MINLQPYGKFAYDIIRFLDENKDVKVTDLLNVVKSADTLYRTLPKMKAADIIIEKDRVDKRRFVYIYLTEKGKRIADGLRKAEQEASQDTSQRTFSDAPPGITLGKSQEHAVHTMPSNFEDQFKNFSAMTHFNVLGDHIAIRDVNFDGAGHERVVYVYVKLNGHNILRLWCEVDNTFDCPHTRFAWTLPDVQEMVQIERDKGNINRVSKK